MSTKKRDHTDVTGNDDDVPPVVEAVKKKKRKTKFELLEAEVKRAPKSVKIGCTENSDNSPINEESSDDDDNYSSGNEEDSANVSAIQKDDVYRRRFLRPALTEKEIENVANRPSTKISSKLDKTNDCFDRFTLPRLQKTWNSGFDPLQGETAEIYKTLMTYKDFSFPKLSGENITCVSNLITLHALNHVLKARCLVVENSRFLTNLELGEDDYEVDDYRDQSMTRASVLILTPFRNTAYNIFSTIVKLFETNPKKQIVQRKKRFRHEYGPEGQCFKNFEAYAF